MERRSWAGAAGEGGEGKQAKPQSGLIPLPRPPEPPAERTRGHPTLSDKQSRATLVQRKGWELPFPAGEQTLSLPPAQRGRGASASASAHPPVFIPRRAQGQDSGSLLGNTHPTPDFLLPYLPEDWESVSKLLPTAAPSISLGSLWEARTGRKRCRPDPDPLSCFSARPSHMGPRDWRWQPMSLKSAKSPALMGSLSGSPGKSL